MQAQSSRPRASAARTACARERTPRRRYSRDERLRTVFGATPSAAGDLAVVCPPASSASSVRSASSVVRGRRPSPRCQSSSSVQHPRADVVHRPRPRPSRPRAGADAESASVDEARRARCQAVQHDVGIRVARCTRTTPASRRSAAAAHAAAMRRQARARTGQPRRPVPALPPAAGGPARSGPGSCASTRSNPSRRISGAQTSATRSRSSVATSVSMADSQPHRRGSRPIERMSAVAGEAPESRCRSRPMIDGAELGKARATSRRATARRQARRRALAERAAHGRRRPAAAGRRPGPLGGGAGGCRPCRGLGARMPVLDLVGAGADAARVPRPVGDRDAVHRRADRRHGRYALGARADAADAARFQHLLLSAPDGDGIHRRLRGGAGDAARLRGRRGRVRRGRPDVGVGRRVRLGRRRGDGGQAPAAGAASTRRKSCRCATPSQASPTAGRSRRSWSATTERPGATSRSGSC